MRLTRREFTATALAAAIAPAPVLASGEIHRSHGASLIGDLKYPADFQHFDYVNPNAPKGGTAREATLSDFDSFNPFILKGDPPQGIALIFDSLMTPSADQASEEYGLLAEWIEHPDDFSWVSFKIRDEAHWHDGRPITVEDVIFSLDILKTSGHPQYRLYYKNVLGGRDLGGSVVRFDFDVKNNRELPHIVGQLSILPKHWWAGREFAETSLEPMLGSGPYKIGEFESGRFIEYERVENYWGANLPVNRGRYNFDYLRFEVFRDGETAFEGFKSGEFDYREENSAKKWATQYEFPALDAGLVKQETIPLQRPQRAQILAMNLRRDKFKDIRIRKALSLAYDFEELNRTVYYDQYARVSSYFQGSPSLTPTGSPTGQELEMLESIRDLVPEQVFGPAYEPPKTKGDGRNRRQMRQAAKLLKQAGCEVRDGKLYLPGGERFAIEFLIWQSNSERAVNPFIKNLQGLGIDASIRLVDRPQYIRILLQDPEFDWDMVVWAVSNSSSPGNEQREFWGSEAATKVGARNLSGVADPAVDNLIDKIIFAKNRSELEAASKALDRVLSWNHYAIFQLYSPNERIAWWDKFGRPKIQASRQIGFPSLWWWDKDKAAALEAQK